MADAAGSVTWADEYATATANATSEQWVDGWDGHKGGGGYYNTFSGRDTSKSSWHSHTIDACWKFEIKVPGSPAPQDYVEYGSPEKKKHRIDIMSLVELFCELGWEACKNYEIKEAMMPAFVRFCDLQTFVMTSQETRGGSLQNLDLEQADFRQNLIAKFGNGWESDPETFTIMAISELAKWVKLGTDAEKLDAQGEALRLDPADDTMKAKEAFSDPLEWTKAGPHNAGSEAYNMRHIKNPGDCFGLVADKLGRAIANERMSDGKRKEEGGKRLEPVFTNVYSLAHVGFLKGMNDMTEFASFGVFQAVAE